MIPREPDRCYVVAHEVTAEWKHRNEPLSDLGVRIAAALRTEHANAIEWVAVNLYGGHHAAAIRALASPAAAVVRKPWWQEVKDNVEAAVAAREKPPAAAPAAETDAPNGPVCGCGRPSRYESGWCGETSCFANIAAPSEPAAPEKDLYRVYEEDRAAYRAPEPAPLPPRVLAALEQDARAGNVSARRLESLAAELRAYIAEREPAEKRIAELEAALLECVGIVDAAGLLNLSNGVQLGQTSWYVKAFDAFDHARKLAAPAAAAKGEGKK